MTAKNLIKTMIKYNIPGDAVIRSNSGWEGGSTAIRGFYYSVALNEIHLVPSDRQDEGYVLDYMTDTREQSADWTFYKIETAWADETL